MFLVESYAQGRMPSLGSRLRLSGAGVSGEVVYAGVTHDGHPVVMPLTSVLRGVRCDPITCVDAAIESVDDRTGDSDARSLLELLGGKVNFHLATRQVSPSPGDVLETVERPLMYCGTYRSKLVFASTESHGLQHLGAVNSKGLRWNIGIFSPANEDVTGRLRGFVGRELAEGIFRSVTSRAYPGARVGHRGIDGTYLRWDGRYGLHHLVAFEVNDSTRSKVADLDVDRLVEVDGTRYAVAFVTSFGDSMTLFEFPEVDRIKLALRIEEAVPVFRRML